MSTISIPAPDALSDRGSRGVRAWDEVMKGLGWVSEMRALSSVRSRKLPLWELAVANEPTVLIAAPSSQRPDRIVSLGYSRQARYAISWEVGRLSLYDMLRWREKPGDLPLFSADLDVPGDVREFFGLIARDQVIEEAPSDLVLGTSHICRDALPGLLGGALRQLRIDVANGEAYQGRDATGADTAVLRLFHQLLYVRVSEDRRRSHSKIRIANLIDPASGPPNRKFAELLADYRKAANSELFEPAAIDIAALPGDSLADVLRQTVEPWARLRLDFSVARADLAGRLYESYLASQPVAEKAEATGRLFSVAKAVDQREKRATFYTPPALARTLTRRTLDGWAKGRKGLEPRDIRIADCACGSGAFLTASFEWLRLYFEDQRGRVLRSPEREELLVECIFGGDVDERALGMAQVQLLEVAEITGQLPKLQNNLLQGDALPAPPGVVAIPSQIDWSAVVHDRGSFTSILGNPPFGSQVKLPSRLSVEQIAHIRQVYPEIRSFGQDYAYFFLALALRLLSTDGAAGFVMPRGLIALAQGRSARQMLSSEHVSWLADLRAARVFPGASTSVAAVVFQRGGSGSLELEGARDSRLNARVLLDELGAGGVQKDNGLVRLTTTPATLVKLTDQGWTPFRVRWKALAAEIKRPVVALLGDPSRAREVRTGVKPGRVAAVVVSTSDCQAGTGETVEFDGNVVPARFLPLLVYGAEIEPFRPLEPARRILLPFERDGTKTVDPSVLGAIQARGGLPANFQRGHLPTLLGPKVLLRAFGREPAAVADPDGHYVPIMRGVHAIRFKGLSPDDLDGVAALLNCSFYQWMLRGLGSPRADETVEVSISNIAELPWPSLTATELRVLRSHAQQIRESLKEPTAPDRIQGFHDRRNELDEFAWELLGASPRLRDVVDSETLRLA